MKFLDTRRLTGPNILGIPAGAILDIACSPNEADLLVPFCKARAAEMLAVLGWPVQPVRHHKLSGGVSIAFSAPVDRLYAAAEIGDWIWACCEAEFNAQEAPSFDDALAAIAASAASEMNPALLSLQDAAAAHQVAFLWDDDEVSVGQGHGSTTWPVSGLPDPAVVDWTGVVDVPVGIVTGTNGKTSSVRFTTHILQSSGRSVGVSCTDWVAVNGSIIDRDDWSGPGGARKVLRHTGIDVAILETARGGLLRRGLGVPYADAALITNVSEDHLGDFGSRSVLELLDIKWVVSRAVETSGCLILNADDPLLVDKAAGFAGRIVWFSLADDNPTVAAHVASGGLAYVYRDARIFRRTSASSVLILPAKDIPVTLGGAALHNVANALAAAALSEALGASVSDIRNGLRSMSQEDNPGRSNLYAVKDFKVLVDFAHNPKAVQALFDLASALPARRRVLCFGQAGDRTDEQIRELARSAWSMQLDMVMISELAEYRRGRAPREVYDILRDELLRAGARDEQVCHFESEDEAFSAALSWAGTDDLVLILDLGRKSGIREKVRGM